MNALGHRRKTLHKAESVDQVVARIMHQFLAHKTSIQNNTNTNYHLIFIATKYLNASCKNIKG